MIIFIFESKMHNFFVVFLFIHPSFVYLFTFCVYPFHILSTCRIRHFLLKLQLFTKLSTLSTNKLWTNFSGYLMSIINICFVHIHEIAIYGKKSPCSIDKSSVRYCTEISMNFCFFLFQYLCYFFSY